MSLNKKLCLKLIDAILEKCKDWMDVITIGKHEYYPTEYSMHIDAIEQFHFDIDFINKFPKLKDYIEIKIQEKFNLMGFDVMEFDKCLFDAWFYGGNYLISFDGFQEPLRSELENVYRERITEEYPCEECKKIISEKHPYGHPNHLHRTGFGESIVKDDKGHLDTEKSTYKYKYLCEDCNDKVWKIGKYRKQKG